MCYRIKIIKKLYVKRIILLHKLTTYFDLYKVIIRPSFRIKSSNAAYIIGNTINVYKIIK